MTTDAKKNLPWVEKYRPRTLEELISHADILKTIKRFVDNRTLPHLLLYGPPGTGKTTTILACARQLYQKDELKSTGMVLELNASDDRGISVVRDRILDFAESKALFNKNFKLVILDEADAMTNDAQAALRRVMEKYSNSTRFCLICNYLSKITPAIQSRCTKFRFAPLLPEQILPRLDYIIAEEGVKCNSGANDALIGLAEGDMRRVINTLQSTHMAFGEVTEENVYKTCGQPTKEDIEEIQDILMAKNLNLSQKFQKVIDFQQTKGLAVQDMVTQLHLLVQKSKKFTRKQKMNLVLDMADVEVQLASGGSERIQLSSLMAAFHQVVVGS